MKLLSMVCKNCNGQLEVNVEKMQAYCPYCGHKLLFDLDQIEMVLAEKEKTKREEEKTKRMQIKQEYVKEKEKRETKTALIVMFFCFIVMPICFLLVCLVLSQYFS